jgi:acetolactate synthase-1/2/3 large subunit
MVGMHGRFAATKSMYSSDLIIAIGTRFSDRATGNKVKFCPNAKIIHIDIDEAEINKNIPCNVGIVGALAPILTTLTKKVGSLNHDEWTKEVQEYKDLEYSRIVQPNEMNPKVILEEVRKHAKDSTAVATDVGQHQMWVTQFYDFSEPRKLITSGGLGTMGFGLGAAIGACIANNKEMTVMVTGDGSFHMNFNELATCARYNLPVKVILLNNNVLGMVRQWQTVFYDKHYSQTTLDRKTNYKALAEAMGGSGYVANNPEELKAACEKAFNEEGFSLIDCRIDSDEFVLPMIPANGSISDIIMKKEEN